MIERTLTIVLGTALTLLLYLGVQYHVGQIHAALHEQWERTVRVVLR